MEKQGKYSSVGKYAGLAFQWAIMLGLAVWGGMKLDEKIGVKALLVIVFPLLALAVSLYQIIRESNPKKPK